MEKNATVLVTTAGTILGQGIIKCLKLENASETGNINYNILTTDMSSLASGSYRSNKAFLVPSFSSYDYLDSIIKICKENEVDAIFIGADEELIPLTKNKKKIKKETGTTVISNSLQVIETCFDKWKTYEFLRKNNLPCASSCLPDDVDSFSKDFDFPYVVKPRVGHGSINFHVVQNREELENAIKIIEKSGGMPIIQEHIDGKNNEFTTGITTNKSGTNVMSSIAIKKTIRNGQTYKGFIENFEEIRESGKKIALKLGCKGPINIQAKLDKKKPKVFEINARFSATAPMRAVAGINEPDIVYRNQILNEEISLEKYDELLCIRYLNEIYVQMKDYKKIESDKKLEQPQSYIPNYF